MHHSRGIGDRLVESALVQARKLGIRDLYLYLLTETAEGYFPRFGFSVLPRENVSPEIHQSLEWTTACPVSARAVVVHLDSGERDRDSQLQYQLQPYDAAPIASYG